MVIQAMIRKGMSNRMLSLSRPFQIPPLLFAAVGKSVLAALGFIERRMHCG
jgi:hypothetical protein